MPTLIAKTRFRSAPAIALAFFWLALTVAPPGAGALEQTETGTGFESPQALVGRSLTEALQLLSARGLKLVFTSSVVSPELEVTVEPTAQEPRQILDEILAPHGLAARPGPDGTFVVVRAQEESGTRSDRGSLAGLIRSRPDLAPVSGANVRVVSTDIQLASDKTGRFLVPDLAAGSHTVEVSRRGFVVETIEVLVARGPPTELEVLLDPAPISEEELLVTPSRISLLRDSATGPIAISRDQIQALPHLGDDFFRALTLLPGATANDVSAQFHVRGGRRDETQILLDGQELYDAYHMKDFDNAVSFIAPDTLGSADLTTGGFSVQYGDRMSGVLNMTTLTPSGAPRVKLGLGILSAHAGGSGSFSDKRGKWLAVVRRGSADLVARLLGDEDPEYWDAFAKFDYRLGPHNSLRFNALHSDDELDFSQAIDGESKLLRTAYSSTYLWATAQTLVNKHLFFETAVSWTRIDRDRRGLELEDDAQFDIRDLRDVDISGIRQEWNYRATPRHALNWGWQFRNFQTDYDYFGRRNFDNPLAVIRHDSPMGTTRFAGAFDADHVSLHAADRIRPGENLTLEIGARYDRHTQTDESRLSPRLNVAYALGERSVVRLAWGRFNQSQRSYELQVEDGESTFHRVERSEHRVLGFERVFASRNSKPGLALRIEAYQRDVGNPRPRYENLYEPFNVFPEVEPERVRIVPERSLARGLELSVRGHHGRRIGWWANYAYSASEDRIEGRWVPRIFDQTHALNLDLDYRIGAKWRLNLAWRFHTGWPTTPLELVRAAGEDGEIEFRPRLGPLNSDRLSSFHRLDLRASRRWRAGSRFFDFFIDLQNVYNRRNAAGFDFEIDDELGVIEANPERWAGFLPSAGLSVEF